MMANSNPPNCPLSGPEIVDEYFIENRTRVLELAAFLDRLDRVDAQHAARDFRMQALSEAVEALSVPGDRLMRIQMLLSDPTIAPLERLDRKSALGAFDRGTKEARS
jgi:hypothetical protein